MISVLEAECSKASLEANLERNSGSCNAMQGILDYRHWHKKFGVEDVKVAGHSIWKADPNCKMHKPATLWVMQVPQCTEQSPGRIPQKMGEAQGYRDQGIFDYR